MKHLLILIPFTPALPAYAQNVVCSGEIDSTPEANVCAADELERADRDLNAVFQQAIRSLEAAEIGFQDQIAQMRRDAVASLRRAQRAWVTVRDETCDGALPLAWGGGTGTT